MRKLLFVPVALAAVLAGGATGVVQDVCGPFTDVSPALCPYVLQMYYLGITAGTSPTTYSPDSTMTRGQAAVFVSKGVNQAIARSSRRAALGQWWNGAYSGWSAGLGITPLSSGGLDAVATDGADVWVTASPEGLFRVRASDGKKLEIWPIGDGADCLLVAMGRVFIASGDPNGSFLAMIDPAQPPGPPSVLASDLPWITGLAFDGSRIWMSTYSGQILLAMPSQKLPWSLTTVETGSSALSTVVFDGRNMWASDFDGVLLKLDSSGAVIQAVTTGGYPDSIAFDGVNFWVPDEDRNTVDLVRAADGALIAEIPAWRRPFAASFDGERVLVLTKSAHTPETFPGFLLFRAADATLLTSYDFLTYGAASAVSDGVNFWLALSNSGQLARF